MADMETRGWRMMETAPRDRPIVGRSEEIRAVAMEWDATHGIWFRDNPGAKRKVSIFPTHWMPLPTPPEDTRHG